MKILSALVPAAALLLPAATLADTAEHVHTANAPPWYADSPLIKQVRKATEQFRDINEAFAAGYVPATPCVSGPNSGAMGVHLINTALLGKELNPETPELIMYEPLPDGRMHLVGFEYLTLASDWVGEVPVLAGQLLNYVGSPNRYGLPAFYEIHIWAWKNNPEGSFADWNPRVSCARQPLPAT